MQVIRHKNFPICVNLKVKKTQNGTQNLRELLRILNLWLDKF
jgi:hypothetical protein